MRIPDNCFVRLVDLPSAVGGAVMMDEEGNANIYINARYGRNAQLESLRHELDHVEDEDAYNSRPIEEVEANEHH